MENDLTPEQLARRAKLADALRSGEYERTTQTLETVYYDYDADTLKRKHCCLGVACREAEKDGIHVTLDEAYDRYVGGNGYHEVDEALISVEGKLLYGDLLTDPDSHHAGRQDAVAEYYGFTDEEQVALARDNDDGRTTWKEIARLIETAEYHV